MKRKSKPLIRRVGCAASQKSRDTKRNVAAIGCAAMKVSM